jgi:adenylate cyclase
LNDLQRAHELNPNDVFVLQLLGACEVAVGLASEGVVHLTQALRNSPRGPWSANIASLLSWAHFFTKDYGSGRQWASRALNEFPNLQGALANLVSHCVGLGEIEQAKTALEAARRLAPAFVESRLNGNYYNGTPEDKKRLHVFWRVAAGLEDPSAADAMR